MLHDTLPNTGVVVPGTPHPATRLQKPSYSAWFMLIALIKAIMFVGELKHSLLMIVVNESPGLIPLGLQVRGTSPEYVTQSVVVTSAQGTHGIGAILILPVALSTQ
jgi:hypothetical protein